MRCANLTTFWGFTTQTGTTRVRVDGITLTTAGSTCTTGQLVVMTNEELTQATASPFKLDLNEAGPIAGAILLVWAAGFGVRLAIQALRGGPETDPETP